MAKLSCGSSGIEVSVRGRCRPERGRHLNRELITAGRHHLIRFHFTTERARYFLDRIRDRLPSRARQGAGVESLPRESVDSAAAGRTG